MNRFLPPLALLFTTRCYAADYAIPYPNHAYVVTVTDARPVSIFLADTTGGTFRRIPQSVHLKDGAFSIFCEVVTKTADMTRYGMIFPKGTITLTKTGAPEIEGKAGELIRPPAKRRKRLTRRSSERV